MRKRLIWLALILFSALLAALAAVGYFPVLIQFVVIGIFLLVMPGFAYIRLMPSAPFIAQITLSIGLSIAITTFVSLIMVLTRFWSPFNGLLLIILITIAGAILQAVITPADKWN